MHEYRNVRTGATVMVSDDVRISGDNWEENVLENDLEDDLEDEAVPTLDNTDPPAKTRSKSSAATSVKKK